MTAAESGTERLHQYWVHGEGAAKIRWGDAGDFDRCVMHLSKYIADAKGYCNLAHHAALGIYPATHAKLEKAGSADMTSRAEMSTQSINDLPDSAFAYIEPGGKKDASGKTIPRSLRHFPVHDEAHARNALARAPQSPFGDRAMPKILAACKKFGIDVSADSDSGRSESLMDFRRSVPFEDISIRSSGDGRTVEAYAAVFNTPAEVRDEDGWYMEELDPSVFSRAIANAAPQGSRRSWKVGVFYNHGRTIMGTASDRYSMPCGKVLDIKADDRGLWTEIRYHRSAVGDEVLENIREGVPGGYSFSGRFLRSTPQIPRGGFQRDYRTGALQSVRRTESTLKELGWTPFPVYQDAEVVGMRAEWLAALAANPDLAQRMLGMFRDGIPEDPPPPAGTPDVGLATEDPPALVRHSGRSLKQEMQAQRSAFLQRYRR